MAVDYDKPTTITQYLEFVSQLRENISEALKLSGAGANVPDDAIRFNSAENRFEKKSAGVWQALRTLAQTFAMRVYDSERLAGHLPAYYRNADNLNAGTLPVERLPNHSANKITSGTLAAARVGNLPADKITQGVFDAARIPDHSAAKLTSGTLPVERLPATLDARGIKTVTVQQVVPGGALAEFDNQVVVVTGVDATVEVVGRQLNIRLIVNRGYAASPPG